MLHVVGVVHLLLPGPAAVLLLQAPNTASSGRSATSVNSGFWYGFFGFLGLDCLLFICLYL
jgi:hypothetical protein